MKRATGKAGLSAEQAGALRAVRVGNHCTQTKAAHWQGGCTKCRFCGAPREDPFHRFWICPRWDLVRRSMLAGLSVARMAAEAPRVLLEHGLLPVAGVLVRARQAAENPAERVGPDPEEASRIYTDGSAVFPGDPWLRRAGWAACWRVEGRWVGHSAGTAGRQTVARSELAAALWAMEAGRGRLTVVTD